MPLDPRASGPVGHDRAHGGCELLRRPPPAVGLEDAGLRLHHLAERPERDALAVRKRAALAPGDELGVLVDRPEELVDEPALADPGDADERHELWRALRAHARGRRRAASSRSRPTSGAPPAARVDADAGARLTASQTATGSLLPFAATGSASR